MKIIKKIITALSISFLIITNSFAGSPGGHILALFPINDAKIYTEKFNSLFNQILNGKHPSCIINGEQYFYYVDEYIEQPINESEYPNILKDKKSLKEFIRSIPPLTVADKQGNFELDFDSFLFYEVNKDNIVLTGVSYYPGEPTRESKLPISEIDNDIVLSNAVCKTLASFPVIFND